MSATAMQSGLDASIMFLWDDVFEEQLRDQLTAGAASQQQEALILLEVHPEPGYRAA